MKNNIKFLLIGLIIGVIIATSSVFALTGSVQKNLNYNNIKITLNGEEITPTDANGTYVEPFAIDGTTYLPVRAIANAMGLDVKWDGTTNTVVLGKNAESSSNGVIIYDKNNVKVTYMGIDARNNNSYTILIENNSDKTLWLRATGIYANGYSMGSGPELYMSIDPGKKAANNINLREDTLNTCGISQVEEIEFTLSIKDSDNDIAKDSLIIHP